MIVLDKLEKRLEAHFGGPDAMSVVTEPSNAMARREIRIMTTKQTLSEADRMSEMTPYVPYELMLELLISVRLSGGNSNKTLSTDALLHSIALNELLTKRLVVLEGVDEVLTDMRTIPTPGWELKIVGDAELVDAKLLNSGFAGAQATDEFEQRKDDLYIWREDWQAKLVMTVHRQFPNPTLRKMIFTNDVTGDEFSIPKEEERWP
jgi:hypothetical protein